MLKQRKIGAIMTISDNNELRAKAQSLLNAMSFTGQNNYLNLWSKIERQIRDNATSKMRVFEVHHKIEVERIKFFQAICDGKQAVTIENEMLD